MDIAGKTLITPSKMVSDWIGTPGIGQWTIEQERAIEREQADRRARRRRPWKGEIFAVSVPSEKPSRGLLPPEITYRVVTCPLLHTTETARLVIVPIGEKRWIERKGRNA